MAREPFDVLIMGAGLSGIDAAHHPLKASPQPAPVNSPSPRSSLA